MALTLKEYYLAKHQIEMRGTRGHPAVLLVSMYS